MKLEAMSAAKLQEVIEQLERTSKKSLDKYKRWEAEQKLKLARAEQRRRQGISGLLYQAKRWFGDK